MARPLVPVNQGIANAGKFLKVDAQGNVTVEAVDIPSVDGLVTSEQLEQAVANLVSSTDLQEAIEAVEAQIPSVEGLATEQYVDQAIEGIDGFVEVAQGSENEGKVLGINAEGNVVPVENTSGLPETEEGIASVIDGGEVKNLFDETTTSEMVEKGFTFGKAQVDAGSKRSIASDTNIYYPCQVFLTGKQVHSIGLVLTDKDRTSGATLNPTLPIEIYIRNWGVDDLSTITTSSPVPSSPAELLCKILPTANDIDQYTKFRLDGTDSRVTEINTTYIKNGVLEVPAQYFIGAWCPNMNTNFNWTYYSLSDVSGTSTGFRYATSSACSSSTGTLCLDFYWDEEETTTTYSFDEYLMPTVQPEPEEQLVPMLEPPSRATGATVRGGVYFLRDISYLNGKYMTGFACQPVKGKFGRFVVGTVDNNATGTGNGGTKPTKGWAISNIRLLFTIDFSNTGYTSYGQSDYIEFSFDGTDPRVTIVATDLFDNEHKGFLWDYTMILGVDDRGQGASSVETGSICFTSSVGDGYWYNHLNTALVGGSSATPATPESRENTTLNTVSSTDLHLVPMYTDIVTPEPYKEIKSEIIKGLVENKSESPLKGKWLSMIGDSISTFEGWSNVAPGSTSAAVYYPKDYLTDVNQTYWKKLVDRTGMKLLVNNSWSGSRCANTKTGDVVKTGTADRCKQLHKTIDGVVVNPDYILINIGTNDYDNMTLTTAPTMGTWNGRGEDYPANPDSLSPTSFREAYAVMLHRLRKNYPLAKIFCCTVPAGNAKGGNENEVNDAGIYLVEFNDAIREIATAFGAHVVELATSGLDYYTLGTLYGDGRLHPSEAGMERYYEIIRRAMENEDSTNVSCPRRSALMTGTATAVTDSTATDVAGVVTDLNALLATLRARGIIS